MQINTELIVVADWIKYLGMVQAKKPGKIWDRPSFRNPNSYLNVSIRNEALETFLKQHEIRYTVCTSSDL